MRVYFVRHGQTDANIHYDKYPWNTNCSLNKTGRQEVRHAADYLHDEAGVDYPLIMASPLTRAQQTAAIIAKRLNADVIIDDHLQELQVGDWQNRDIATVYAYFMGLSPVERFMFKPPNGESWAECGRRVADAVLKQKAQDIVLVSHSAPIQTAIGTLLQSTYDEWASYEIKNASVSLLTLSDDSWRAEYIGRIFDPSSRFGLP